MKFNAGDKVRVIATGTTGTVVSVETDKWGESRQVNVTHTHVFCRQESGPPRRQAAFAYRENELEPSSVGHSVETTHGGSL